MNPGSLALLTGALLVAPLPALAKLPPEKLAELPPPATHQVDFAREIRPILNASCAKCHGRGKDKGGFRIDTRADFLQDADSGPSVVVGNSRDSYLIHLVSALDPDNVMPDKGSRLTAEQVGLLRAWIDQGLKWDDSINFAREPHRNLKPRQPEVPAATAELSAPLDRLVGAYLARNGQEMPLPVDDTTYARRVYFDVVGLPPTPEELQAFLADESPDKRTRLVNQLLNDRNRYAQHWLSFWNDLLRNDYRGTGYIDGGREQITAWLYAALRDNKPYDQFVRELVNPGEKGPRGFTKGIVWRGVVNASQTPQMQAAQNIAQVFLGVNLKCASCHDSFIDDWQLADAYGMAGVYAEEKLELVECDKPLGRHVPVKFIFPEFGSISDDAPRADRVARLAELITTPDNGRLTRTVVNRFWARLMGRGLVEPVDVMQNPAWDPDLLDWLAEDFVRNRYDLKHTLRTILTSRAYQMPAVPTAAVPEPTYVFRGPGVRRLSAEQFADALGQLTGVWHDRPEGGLDGLITEVSQPKPLPAEPYWIWSDPHAAATAAPQTIYVRRTVELKSVPSEAVAWINADNSQRLWVNGREASRKTVEWSETVVVDLRPFLKVGANVFALEARNGGDAPNPAGLLFYARLRGSASEPPQDVGSDAAWLVSTQKVDGWTTLEGPAEGWKAAQVLGPAGMAPWNIGAQFLAAASGKPVYGRVRAAPVSADPLTTALGRPNREQVNTVRQDTATTLQMLELTNGATLAALLERGAARLVNETPDGRKLIDKVFQRGLGRLPSPEETTLSLALLGDRPTPDGVEDFLWSMAMLPEFQFVR